MFNDPEQTPEEAADIENKGWAQSESTRRSFVAAAVTLLALGETRWR
jgi:hypothetical protein